VVLCVSAVSGAGSVRRVKRQLAISRMLEASTSDSIIDFKTNVDPQEAGCTKAEVGAAKCQQLIDAAADANIRITAMLTALDKNHKDAKFTAAFGAGDEGAVKTCLTSISTGKLYLFNAYSNREGKVWKAGDRDFAGMGIVPGTKNMIVGPSAYSFAKKEMAEHMIHEATHAHCATIDLHGGKNGYKDSSDFAAVKSPTNADSYRVYCQQING